MVYTDKADTLPPLYQRKALPVLHLLSPAYSLYMTQAPTITNCILKGQSVNLQKRELSI